MLFQALHDNRYTMGLITLFSRLIEKLPLLNLENLYLQVEERASQTRWQGWKSRICSVLFNYKTKQEPLKQQVHCFTITQSIVVGNKHSDRDLMVLFSVYHNSRWKLDSSDLRNSIRQFHPRPSDGQILWIAG